MNGREGKVKKTPWKRRNVIIFEFAGRKCAAPSRRVREIILMPMLSKGPGLPSILEGVMNLDGAAAAVIRLDRLFGLEEKKSGLYTPLLVLSGGETQLALLVDRVWEVKSVAAHEVMSLDGHDALNGCIEAELNIEGETVHLLSVDRIMLECGQKNITEFLAVEQERLNGMEAE